jgi:hypothetical protein
MSTVSAVTAIGRGRVRFVFGGCDCSRSEQQAREDGYFVIHHIFSSINGLICLRASGKRRAKDVGQDGAVKLISQLLIGLIKELVFDLPTSPA